MSLLDTDVTTTVLKRDGRSVRFDASKIYRAIEAAMNDRGLEDHAFVSQATNAVIDSLPADNLDIPTIQSAVEDYLMASPLSRGCPRLH
ncbi:ATP cone domain-containing protein [Trueperella pyogenes]|uniref:ATP cone domain-containing protein n=1 Tax=Trueperella pyogenes TaxID=1661 RepID=UPI003DA7C526